ncbi:hypothetical protein, partial [Peribacillus frigoritolerans]|uniref:hypothetical protein n=1 Tax=Peribacillus frigoritolerans TaxID=450367 RepID=UPI002E23443F|nr:hypothetical protein [Peribacillus frigoritolerans]
REIGLFVDFIYRQNRLSLAKSTGLSSNAKRIRGRYSPTDISVNIKNVRRKRLYLKFLYW